MEPAVLSDPQIYPSEEVLYSHLGKAKQAFISFTEHNQSDHPDFVGRWKYYNDGKRWLFNASRKKKTVFWLSIGDGFFRVSFYFNPKAEKDIVRSKIPGAMKSQYMVTAGEKFRAIPVVIKAKKDLEIYKELVQIKLKNI